MALFSPGVGSILNRQQGIPSAPQAGHQDPQQRFLLDFTGKLSTAFAKAAARGMARDALLKDNQYLVASGVGQARFDFGLTRELSKFYTSDGRDVTPPDDYSADLGFGISLSAGDFLDKGGTGRRRTYLEMVRHMQDKFIDARVQLAPSDRAEGMVRPRLDKGKLSSEVNALKYSHARNKVVVANNLNSVVRAYKETLSETRGYDPVSFGLHLNGILEASEGGGTIDPGMGRQAALTAMSDLVKVGVTEAHTDRDNAFALEVLAASPLRNTEMVNKAITGLPARDQSYMRKLVSFTRKRKRIHKRGDALPGEDVREYLPWAMAQMSQQQRDDIQDRAVKAMVAQTEVARGELDERLKGLVESMTSATIKDPGFREMLRGSAVKALEDSERLYPSDLYPVENAKAKARAVIPMEMMELRNSLDNMNTHALVAMQRSGSFAASLSSRVNARVGKARGGIYAMAMRNTAEEVASAYVTRELEMRSKDPYGSVLRTSKDIRELEAKLARGNYPQASERARDQVVLRNRVKKRANELGVRPSFLTGTDAVTLKNFSALGNTAMIGTYVRALKKKYGEVTFHDYIVPEMAKDKIVGEMTMGFSLLPDDQIAGIVMDADANYAKNKGLLADLGHTDALKKELGSAFNPSWWDSFKGADPAMERINNTISDRLGDGYAGQVARTSAAASVRNLAASLLATGRHDNAEDAVEAAVAMYSEGMGNVAEFNGRNILLHPVVSASGMNAPRIARLEEVLETPEFLRERVYPNIVPNRHIMERSAREKVTPESLMERYFEDDELIKWRFGAEGLYPVIMSPTSPDFSGGIPDRRGGNFMFPYEELPSLLYWGT